MSFKIISQERHSLWLNVDFPVEIEVCIWLFLQEKF